MNKIKCITFDKAAQDALPEHIKEKMKRNMEEARAKNRPFRRASCPHTENGLCDFETFNPNYCDKWCERTHEYK
jgi:hypothetical protein